MLTEKDIEILNVLKNKEGKISPARTNEKYLRKHGYYEYLLNRYSDNTIPNCIPETLYRLINDIEMFLYVKHVGTSFHLILEIGHIRNGVLQNVGITIQM